MSRVRRDVVMLVASLAVFTICAVVAADGRVGPIERAAFHAVNGLPGWLYRPMLLFQYLGVLAMPLVVAVAALAFRRWRLAAALVLVVPRRWAVVAFVLATLNAVARVYLGAHNPLDVVGGAAVGLAIAAAMDLVLDVARDRGGSRPRNAARAGE